jgi:hypothetical protein
MCQGALSSEHAAWIKRRDGFAGVMICRCISLQGLTPEEQWRRVSHACTKRYCGCLKRLAGKVGTCATPAWMAPYA